MDFINRQEYVYNAIKVAKHVLVVQMEVVLHVCVILVSIVILILIAKHVIQLVNYVQVLHAHNAFLILIEFLIAIAVFVILQMDFKKLEFFNVKIINVKKDV